MHRDILESVSEAFSYVLLDDPNEKVEFQQKIEDFDATANELVKSAYLDRPENEDTLKAYITMMKAKEDMVAAANAMFSEYEDNGVLSKNVAQNFEIEVDRLTTAYDVLLEEILKKL